MITLDTLTTATGPWADPRWSLSLNQATAGLATVSVDGAVSRSGRGAGAIRFGLTSDGTVDTYRAELSGDGGATAPVGTNRQIARGQEFWFGFSALPDSANDVSMRDGELIMQMHATSSAWGFASPSFLLAVSRGRYIVEQRYDPVLNSPSITAIRRAHGGAVGQCVPGQWADFVLHIIPSLVDGVALTELYLDGRMVYQSTKPNTYNQDGFTHYLKMGVYAWAWRTTPPDAGVQRIWHYDDVRVGDSATVLADFARPAAPRLVLPQSGFLIASGGVATAPAAMTVGQWSAEATTTAGQMGINITALPSDGGSAITALEYRVGTGAAIALTGTGTGLRVVTAGFTAGTAVDIQVRAANAIGAGAWSDVKNRTPLAAPVGGAVEYVGAGATYTQYSAQTTHTVAVPAGMQAGDMLVFVAGDVGDITGVVTNTSQALVSRVAQLGSIWSVVISGTVPTSIAVTLSAAVEFRGQALAYRGVTQVAGTTNLDIIAEPRNTLQYSTDAANAAVVIAYVRTNESVTAATFNAADPANHLVKFDFNPVGVVAGIHDGATGSNSAAVTWSAADGGGRYISAAFRA